MSLRKLRESYPKHKMTKMMLKQTKSLDNTALHHHQRSLLKSSGHLRKEKTVYSLVFGRGCAHV